jgi:hypothetical protein
VKRSFRQDIPHFLAAILGGLAVYLCWPDKALAPNLAMARFCAAAIALLFVLFPLAGLALERMGFRRRIEAYRSHDRLTLLFFPLFLLVAGFGHAVGAWKPALTGLFLLILGIKGYLLVRFLAWNTGREVRKSSWALFLAAFLVYGFLGQWVAEVHRPDGDEPYFLLIAESLIRDGDVDLANNYAHRDYAAFYPGELRPQTNDPVGRHGEQFSRHPATFPILLAPFYWIGGRRGAILFVSLVAALAMRETYLISRRLFRGERPALYAWALAAFTPPFLLYSSQLWVEVPAALCIAFSVRKILELGDVRGKDLFSIALALLLLTNLKLRFGLAALPLAVFSVFRARKKPLLAVLLLAAVLVSSFVLLYWNQHIFGKSMRKYDWGDLRIRPGEDYLRGAFGMLFDLAFGLFSASPVYWLGLVGFFLALMSRQRKRLLFVALFLPYLYFIVPLDFWYGAWSPPSRYLVSLVPVLAQFMAAFFAYRRGKRLQATAGLLTILSLGAGFFYSRVPGLAYHFADGTNHLLNALGRALHEDMNRFFPSFIRISWSTFVFPAAAVALSFVLALLARRRRPVLPQRVVLPGMLPSLLLFGGLLLGVALHRTFPPQRVEFEDAWVQKKEGRVFPGPWVEDRERYTGSLAVRNGDAIRVDLRIPKGESRMALRMKLPGGSERTDPRQAINSILSISIDGKPVHTVRAFRTNWCEESFPVRGDGRKHHVSIVCEAPVPESPERREILLDKLMIFRESRVAAGILGLAGDFLRWYGRPYYAYRMYGLALEYWPASTPLEQKEKTLHSILPPETFGGEVRAVEAR